MEYFKLGPYSTVREIKTYLAMAVSQSKQHLKHMVNSRGVTRKQQTTAVQGPIKFFIFLSEKAVLYFKVLLITQPFKNKCVNLKSRNQHRISHALKVPDRLVSDEHVAL